MVVVVITADVVEYKDEREIIAKWKEVDEKRPAFGGFACVHRSTDDGNPRGDGGELVRAARRALTPSTN